MTLHAFEFVHAFDFLARFPGGWGVAWGRCACKLWANGIGLPHPGFATPGETEPELRRRFDAHVVEAVAMEREMERLALLPFMQLARASSETVTRHGGARPAQDLVPRVEERVPLTMVDASTGDAFEYPEGYSRRLRFRRRRLPPAAEVGA